MSMAFIGVPLIVFMIFVAPLWLILHYRSKRRTGAGLSGPEMEQLQELVVKAETMQKRVATLEKILDAEVPEWRQR